MRPGDLAAAEALLDVELAGRLQARRGELVDVLEGDGIVAVNPTGPMGLVSWLDAPDLDEAEIRAVVVARGVRRQGLGRRLLDAATAALRERGFGMAWLVTTNDNGAAIHLYEQAGYHLRERRAGAVDELRRTLKPSIPQFGEGGIRISDELEFVRRLR